MTRYIKSGTVNTVQEINSELERIQASQVDFLARDGQAPNAMQSTIDMNGSRIINLPSPVSLQEPLRLQDLDSFNTITGDIILASEIKVFTNVAALVATDDLDVGQVVKTKGYTTANDGGGAEYIIVATATGTDDGGSYLDLALNQAELIISTSINVKQFGAKGDGITDDTLPIQASIDSLLVANLTKGTYLITSQLTLTDNQSIVGTGSKEVKILQTGAGFYFAIATPDNASTALTQTNDVLHGDLTNAITNTCVAGDFIRYKSSDLYTDRWTTGVVRAEYVEAEILEIESATTSVVTFKNAPFCNMLVASTVNVEFFTPTKNIVVKGITVERDIATFDSSSGVRIRKARDVSISDVKTINYANTGITIEKTFYVSIEDTLHIGGTDDVGTNYGISISDGSKYVNIESVKGYGCRHVIAGTGTGYANSMYVNANNLVADNSGSHSFDAHANTAFFTYTNIQADRSFSLAGVGHKVINVSSSNENGRMSPAYEGGINCLFKNVTCFKSKGLYANEAIKNSTFEDFTLEGTGFTDMSIPSDSTGNTWKNLRVVNTEIGNATTSAEADAQGSVVDPTSGIFKVNTKVDGLHLEGFAIGMSLASSDIVVKNVTLKNCGWLSSLTTADSIIRVTVSNRLVLDSVNIVCDNTGLTPATAGLLMSGFSSSEISISNIYNSGSVVACYPARPCSVSAGYTDLRLDNVRLYGASGAVFSGAGKFTFNTIVADN